MLFYRKKALKYQYYFNNETFEGYNDYINKPNMLVDNMTIRLNNIPNYFKPIENEFVKVVKELKNEIGINILKQIFGFYDLENKFDNFKKYLDDEFIIYAHYPKISEENNFKIGIPAHKDFDFLTLLHITIPGLEYKINQEWVPINPNDGYILINLSSALSYSLGGQITSAEHRVLIPKEERLSMGLFLASKAQNPVIDLTNDKRLFSKYSDYLNSEFKKHNLIKGK